MKTFPICIFIIFVVIVRSTHASDQGNRYYYPLFWFGRTDYRDYNRYRNVRWSLENLKRRSTTTSYAEIGSAWGR
ncbi:hypothetical protein HZH66_002627 [Vespula vulgaris]|uniref:Uncharacterized protein n=1 Tax=Vespula vulgaris TaxID=7454 RepID=A0A834NFE4_VESVU|nr:hypothetical protein HZH66_002627 [Vespula vulgaris]